MIRVVTAKLRSYGSFLKFLALHAAAIVLVVYVASRFTNLDVQGTSMQMAKLFSAPEVWRTVGALTRWLFFIPAFFTVQLVCAELELKLVRAQVVAGLEHHDVILGWVAQNVVLTLFGTVVAFIAAAVFGRLTDGLGLEILVPSALGFALYGLGLLNCAVLAAVLMRRPVPAIILLVLTPLVLESIAGYLFEKNGVPTLREYLPFASMSTLVPWPGATGAIDFTAPVTILGAVYGFVAALVAWVRLKTMDL